MSLPIGKYGSASGRWSGFGPYYAMFPVQFAQQVIDTMTPKGGHILDPFCGRGTAPFVAQTSGHSALGIDINPVAWLFAEVKTLPESNVVKLLQRLEDLRGKGRPRDTQPENEFQHWAWSPGVLGFLNTARRDLDWRKNITDRTLMGFILVNLHGRLNDSISNQMQKSRAMGPDYAVRWWKKRRMRPPEVDPYTYFRKRIQWRYAHGVIKDRGASKILQGDAAKVLSGYKGKDFDLLFTSPPYFGITNYRQDSWIRLWMLGEGPPLPDWKKDPRDSRQASYRHMLCEVLSKAKKRLKPNGVVWLRTDARTFTKHTTLHLVRELWPNRKRFMRYDRPRERTQTAHFNDVSTSPGEVDFLMPGNRRRNIDAAWTRLE